MSDVDNHAEYKAKSMGIGAGTSGGGGGFGTDSDNAKSITRAGISGYAGNLVARTGDAESGIPKIFDVDKVQRELDAQVTITRAFGQVAPKAVADFADRKTQRYSKAKLAKEGLETALANETDPERRAQLEQARDEANQYLIANQNDYDKWREGGVYRVALHAALGGLAGGFSGALGAGAAASAAPAFNELQDRLARSLTNAGASENTAAGIARLITGVTAAGVGGAITGGDFAGSGQAFNVDSNNRQLHEEEVARIKRLAKGDKEKEQRLTDAACALVKCYAEYPEGSPLYAETKASADRGASAALAAERKLLSKQEGLFAYTSGGINPFNDERVDEFRRFISPRTSADIASASPLVNGVSRVASLNLFGGVTDNGYTDLASQILSSPVDTESLAGQLFLYNTSGPYPTGLGVFCEPNCTVGSVLLATADAAGTLATVGPAVRAGSALKNEIALTRAEAEAREVARAERAMDSNFYKEEELRSASPPGGNRGTPVEIEPRGPVQLDEFSRLNQTDFAVSKPKPGEASAAVEIQNELGGTLRRADAGDGNVDFVFTDGPMKGKTVDFLFTADSQKKADGINRFFAKNLEGNKAQIISHLDKADIVPIDLRNLNPTNRSLVLDFVKTLNRTQQSKIVLIK
jgi:hypothetical protein